EREAGSPPNATVDGSFFTFTGFGFLVNGTQLPADKFKVVKATMAEFPALNGQSVSYATLLFPNGTANPPHTHPRAAELLFVVDGELQVGFFDTAGKLYTQALHVGDMFVFPKGLVHFQYNAGAGYAIALSAFGSASTGTVSLPGTLFAVLQLTTREREAGDFYSFAVSPKCNEREIFWPEKFFRRTSSPEKNFPATVLIL
ncbi:unnamed protein product, partial [Linum tenue]